MENSNPDVQIPVTPQPAAMPPQQSGGPKKGLIIGLSIGGGVLALLIITIIILAVTLWAGPSRADYRKAATVMGSVSRNYSSANSYLSSYASSAAYGYASTSSLDNFQEAFDKYKTDVNNLGEEKALKDDEVKKAYDAFKTKNDAFVAYVDELASSLDSFSKVTADCSSSKLGTSVYSGVSNPDEVLSRFDTAVKPCQAALTELESVKNESLAKFGKEMSVGVVKMRSALAEMVAAAKAKNQTKLYAAQSELLAATRDVRNVGSGFSTQFRKEIREVEVKDELNALGQLLTDRANNR